MSAIFLHEILGQLRAFKRFPKYQFERRADAFIGFFLRDVLKARLGHDATVICPEFPIRAHATKKLSSNIDYACFDPGNGALALVELKTDPNSVTRKQIADYMKAMDTPWVQHISDIEWIASDSIEERKYEFLLDQIKPLAAPDSVFGVYLAPAAAEQKFLDKLKELCRSRGWDFEDAQAMWRFISLEDFATTKIETSFGEEWKAVSHWLKETFADG